ANVAVAVFAGNRLGEVSYTDDNGNFSVDPPIDAEGIVYARRDNQSAISAPVQPGTNLSMVLRDPGKLIVRVKPALPGKISLWTSPGGLAGALPGSINGTSFTGDTAQLDRPAGELAIHVVSDLDPRRGGHA